MKVLSFCFCFCLILTNTCNALDFNEARHRKMFRDIGGDRIELESCIFMFKLENSRNYTIHPENLPSLNLYYDNTRSFNQSVRWPSDLSLDSSESEGSRRTLEIDLGICSNIIRFFLYIDLLRELTELCWFERLFRE